MTLHIQVDEWIKNQDIIYDEWTTMWTTNVVTFKAKFYHAIWQLNSPYVQVKLSYNDGISLNLDLNELQQDFKLSLPNRSGDMFILTEYYSPNRWILKPPEPFYINNNSNITIEMKSTRSDKIYQLARGISVWGQP